MTIIEKGSANSFKFELSCLKQKHFISYSDYYNTYFQVSIVGVTSRTLRLLVFNIDVNRLAIHFINQRLVWLVKQFTFYKLDFRKHRGLGQSLLDIKDVNLTHGKLVKENLFHFRVLSFQNWSFLICLFSFQNLNADLQRFINSSEHPEILLSICYNGTLCRLTVNVVEGRFFKVILLA